MRPKQEAYERFEDAMARGQQAVLTGYSDSAIDILQLNIGALKPGDHAKIRVRLLKTLEVEDEYCLFRLPTSYFQRFEKQEGPVPNQLGFQGQHLALKNPEFAYSFRIQLE